MAYVALITAEEARTQLPGLTGTAQDTLIDDLIVTASAHCANYCFYPKYDQAQDPSLASQSYTIYLEADLNEPRRLLSPVWPVQSITTIHADPSWEFGSSTLLESSEYTILGGVEIWLKPSATGAFAGSARSNKIVLVAGHGASTGAIPDSIKRACAIVTRHLWDLRKAQGISNVSRGKSATLIEGLPLAAKELLGRYRLASI